MDVKSILKSVMNSNLQWNNFVSDFALIDSSIIKSSTHESTQEPVATDPLTFL